MFEDRIKSCSSEKVLIAIGSNIAPERNLPEAVQRLSALYETNVLKASTVWESAPVGYLDQPAFCNAAIIIETNHNPIQLKNELLKIEQILKRVRDPNNKNGPRTIDLDISLFGSLILSDFGLQIPDPEIESRPFLAVPLAEVSLGLIHPVLQISMSEIAAKFSQEHGMQKRRDINLTLPYHKK